MEESSLPFGIENVEHKSIWSLFTTLRIRYLWGLFSPSLHHSFAFLLSHHHVRPDVKLYHHTLWKLHQTVDVRGTRAPCLSWCEHAATAPAVIAFCPFHHVILLSLVPLQLGCCINCCSVSLLIGAACPQHALHAKIKSLKSWELSCGYFVFNRERNFWFPAETKAMISLYVWIVGLFEQQQNINTEDFQ